MFIFILLLYFFLDAAYGSLSETAFDSYPTYLRWKSFIYQIIDTGFDTECAMSCNWDTSCTYYVSDGTMCYLGSLNPPTSTIAGSVANSDQTAKVYNGKIFL